MAIFDFSSFELSNPVGSTYKMANEAVSKASDLFKSVIGDFTPEDVTPQSAYLQNNVWRFDIVFDNKSVDPFVLPVNQIHDFEIKHNIIDPVYLSGSITLKSKRLGKILNSDELNTEYVFRGDGEDVLTFRINPKYKEETLPEDIWLMDIICRVYNVEDIPGDGTHMKRIHFYHEPIHILRNRNVPFSTVNYIDSETPVYLMKDEEKKIYTGDAIKHLLIEAGLESYIDEDEKFWDKGSSKIFYTSPPSRKSQDDLTYLLRNHVSTDGQHICLLYYNRGKKKFQLLSLKHFFDNALDEKDKKKPGPYQLDHVWIVPKNIGTDDVLTLSHLSEKAPINKDSASNDNDIKIRNMNLLSEDSFSVYEMSGDKSMWKLVTTPVHTYNFDKKRFTAYVADNEISSIKTEFKEQYTDQLFPGESGDCLLTLNSNKTKNRSVNHMFLNTSNKTDNSSLNYGRNNILYFSVFDNLTMQLILPGSTHRQAGRFMAIEKNEYHDTKYHYKLLGQWFVVTSSIIWDRGNLLNKIEAVKTNTFANLKFDEEEV